MNHHSRLWLSTLLTILCAVAAGYALVSLARWSSLDARLDAAIGGPEHAWLAVERAHAATRAIFASLSTIAAALALGGLAVAAVRQTRRAMESAAQQYALSDSARARLVEAIENHNEGFILFDADDRMEFCNKRFRETYIEIADKLQTGCSYADLLRAGAECGLFPDADGRIDDWLRENMAERRRFTPHEQRLSGDRWTMVSDRPTRDGGFVGLRTDITELKRREAELRDARQVLEGQAAGMSALAEEAQAARALLQDAVESINEGFSLYDRDDRLLMCNSRWLDLHNRVRRLIRPNMHFAEVLEAAIRSGQLIARDDGLVEAEIAERVNARRSNERMTIEEQFDDDRWIRVSTRRMGNGGVVSVLNDITELKQREFALNSTRSRLETQAREMSSLVEAAQRANRAKSDFLAMMSHEIRTPLNGVISALGLVADTSLSSAQTNLIETARNSANGLLAILNDVLDMSKIEAGKLELETAPFRLLDLVEGVARLCRVQAAAKGLSFDVQIDAALPEWLQGDSGRVQQMALNYLTNAIKFTETGSIEFCIRPAPAGRDMIRLEVTDTGIGIPLEQHGRVFRDFTQLDQSPRRRYGEAGLGLAITRRLARAMEGSVGFDSTPDIGSSFWFDVPLRSCAAPSMAPSPPAHQSSPAPLALKILLVEDNDTNRMLARLTLEQMGCRVDEAIDGAQSVEKAANGRYDFILMDISMPVMDGIEAAQQIRAAGSNTPIIALTAHMGEEFAAECEAAGMNGRLTKPVDPKLLRQCLTAGAAMPEKGRSASSKRIDPANPVLDPQPLQSMREALGEAAFFRVLAACRSDIDAEGRALVSALAHGTAEDARRAAHKLVSLAAAIGARQLQGLAQQVEMQQDAAADRLAIAPALAALSKALDAEPAANGNERSVA